MDKKEVQNIAELAKLKLSNEYIMKFTSQFEEILDYIGQLNELKTDDADPIGQPLIERLKLADDEVKSFDNINKLTANAPDFNEGFFRVRKIIE